MCRVIGPVNSAFRYVILVAAMGLLITSGPLWGECTQNYPDSEVTAQLNKAEYTDCTLDVMVQNYAKLLQDKQRLFTTLRSVYKRKLDKEVVSERLDKTELIDRLNDYDTKLLALVTAKDSLDSWAEAAGSDTGSNDTEEISAKMKSKLSKQLKKSKQLIQALKRKIIRAKDELTSAELAEFCKLDFYLRVGEGLNPKISDCLKASN